jgi:hypothetical protein
MKLAELILEVYEKTHWPPEEIKAIVLKNWPHRQDFTPTQAKLVIGLIKLKEKVLRNK